MTGDRRTSASTDEIHALRERVAELEKELGRLQMEQPLEEAAEPGPSLAERAVAGFFEQPLVMLFIADENRELCYAMALEVT